MPRRGSPKLLVRGDFVTGQASRIADGYHRVCSSFHTDQNTPIPGRPEAHAPQGGPRGPGGGGARGVDYACGPDRVDERAVQTDCGYRFLPAYAQRAVVDRRLRRTLTRNEALQRTHDKHAAVQRALAHSRPAIHAMLPEPSRDLRARRRPGYRSTHPDH